MQDFEVWTNLPSQVHGKNMDTWLRGLSSTRMPSVELTGFGAAILN